MLEVALAQALHVEVVPGEEESLEVGRCLGPASGQQGDVVPGEVQVLQLQQPGQGGHLGHLVAAEVQPGDQEETGEACHGDGAQLVVRQSQGVQTLLQPGEGLPVHGPEEAGGNDQARELEPEVVKKFALKPGDVLDGDVQQSDPVLGRETGDLLEDPPERVRSLGGSLTQPVTPDTKH